MKEIKSIRTRAKGNLKEHVFLTQNEFSKGDLEQIESNLHFAIFQLTVLQRHGDTCCVKFFLMKQEVDSSSLSRNPFLNVARNFSYLA